jgi:hypothetical protein
MGPGLGGGHGILQGRFGLVADNIVSLRLTLGNGTSITVNKDSHADLYWGLRGAGQNFGIVTSFDYRVFDVPKKSTWTITTFNFRQDKLEKVFAQVNKYIEKKNRPVELLIWGTLRRNATLDVKHVSLYIELWLDRARIRALTHDSPTSSSSSSTTAPTKKPHATRSPLSRSGHCRPKSIPSQSTSTSALPLDFRSTG